jgi:hypothetical protein
MTALGEAERCGFVESRRPLPARSATLSLAGEGKKEKSPQILSYLASFGYFPLEKRTQSSMVRGFFLASPPNVVCLPSSLANTLERVAATRASNLTPSPFPPGKGNRK